MTKTLLADFVRDSLGNREIAADEILQWARELGDDPKQSVQSLIGFLEETRYELFASPEITAGLNDYFDSLTEPTDIDKHDAGLGASFILATKAFQLLSAVAMQAAVDLAKERTVAAQGVRRDAGIRAAGEPRGVVRTRMVYAEKGVLDARREELDAIYRTRQANRIVEGIGQDFEYDLSRRASMARIRALRRLRGE